MLGAGQMHSITQILTTVRSHFNLKLEHDLITCPRMHLQPLRTQIH
jgi:hypothetical protein